MILYHGSTVTVETPEVIKAEIGRDFGFAFYTTDIEEQAIRWAKRKAMIAYRKCRQHISPVISVYEWIETSDLSVKAFEGATIEWLDMVLKCRSNLKYQHDYDVVVGKIANDNVGETVSYVLQGIMRKEDAIERLKFEKINNQIAFCTEKSLSSLHYKQSFRG